MFSERADGFDAGVGLLAERAFSIDCEVAVHLSVTLQSRSIAATVPSEIDESVFSNCEKIPDDGESKAVY
mgnify:FL=1